MDYSLRWVFFRHSFTSTSMGQHSLHKITQWLRRYGWISGRQMCDFRKPNTWNFYFNSRKKKKKSQFLKNENRHQSKTSKTVETGKPPKLQFLVFTHVVNAWSRFRAHQHNGSKVEHMDGESLSQWLSAFRATREARAYAVATATRTPYIVQWNSAYSGWLSHPVLHEFYTRTCAFDWQFRCALWIKKTSEEVLAPRRNIRPL